MKSLTPRNDLGQFKSYNEINKETIVSTRREDVYVLLSLLFIKKAIDLLIEASKDIDIEISPRKYGERDYESIVLKR